VSDLQIFAENGAETELGRIAVIHHLLQFFVFWHSPGRLSVKPCRE
jgi:hypothetical protein